MEIVESHGAFGGKVVRLSHESVVCQCRMTLSVFEPPHAQVPVLYALGGLTASDVNWATKVASAQEAASKRGVMLVFPDTSPRNCVDGDHALLGYGASYYVDATEEPFAKNYRMFTSVPKSRTHLDRDTRF